MRRKKIGAWVKRVTDASAKKNRFADSSWELYQAVKNLMRGYYMAGATDFATDKLFS